MIKNLCGPFPHVKFMTTGGISNDNIEPYAKSPNVLAVGGSWMVKGDQIEAENWEVIKTKCHQAISALHGFAFKGLALSCTPDQASALQTQLAPFGLASNIPSSKPDIFCSPNGEKAPKLVISTYNLERSVSYLSSYGFEQSPNNDCLNCEKSCILQSKAGKYDIVLAQSN